MCPLPPSHSPLQVTLAWQLTQHVETLVKHKKQVKELTNAAIGLLKSIHLSTNPSVSLSAHHASSLAPTHNLPVVPALLSLLSESRIRQR